MRNIFLSVILLITTFFNTFSASIIDTPERWTAISQGDGDNSDRFNQVIPDGAGNYIAVGYTFESGNLRNILTVKMDASGNIIWSRTKNGGKNGNDEGVAAGVDGSGNIFVTGFRDGGSSDNDIVTIKYDPSGTTIWDTAWDSPASMDDEPVTLEIDNNGNCIIGGNVEPDTASGSSDYVVLKYDPNGVLVWSAQFSRPGAGTQKDELTGMAVDNNNDVYVTGRSMSITDDDYVTIKYDGNSGNQLWLQTYNGGNDDRAVAIAIDNTGAVIVTGRSENGSNDDIRTLKYNNAGNLQWSRVYDSPAAQNDRPIAMVIDGSDNIIIAGEKDIDPTAVSNYDFLTMKYNSAGTLQFATGNTGNTIPEDDQPSAVTVDGSGNIFVTGNSDQNIIDTLVNDDFMTVMYSASGSLQWTKFHAGSNINKDEKSSSILFDNGAVFVAGGSVNTGTQRDATVIKYDPSNGTELFLTDYNGQGDHNESARSIVVDANNNSYIAGYTFDEGHSLNGYIVKFDDQGNRICTYEYDGKKDDDDEFNELVMATNGDIYAVGYSKVTGNKSDMLVVKIAANSCDTVWTRTFDYFHMKDEAEDVVVDAQGNIYVTGESITSETDSTEDNDIVTMKIDGSGSVIWSNRYNGTGSLRDEPSEIILDNAGNVLVSGRTENVHDDDFVILKYNSSTGAEVWSGPATYGGPFTNDDRATDIAVDAADNIFVCGYSQTSSGSNATQDPVVLKFDPSGNQVGFYSYAGNAQDEATNIAVSQSGEVFVMFRFGAGPGLSLNNYDLQIQKFDDQLATVWSAPAQYDSPIHGDDNPADMIVTAAGEVYATCQTENDTNAGAVNKNWITLGYNTSGVQFFSANFDGAAGKDDSPNALVRRGNFLWVAGNVEGSNNDQNDVAVNNYDLIGTFVNENLPATASVYPNPFTTSCLVTLDKDVQNPSLEIYDLTGNKVSEIPSLNGKQFRVEKGNLAAGIYHFRILSNSGIIANGNLIVN